ncbi:hypothetical protein [Mycoplasma sp. 1012]
MNQIKQIKQLGKNTLIIDIIGFSLIFIAIILNLLLSNILETSYWQPYREINYPSYLKTKNLIIFTLFIIDTIIFLISIIFKIMIISEISNLGSEKLADAKLYYVLSVFFGVILTLIAYNKLDNFQYQEEQKTEEKINLETFEAYGKSLELSNIKRINKFILNFEIVNAILIFIATLIVVISVANTILNASNDNHNYYNPYGYNSFETHKLDLTKLAGGVIFAIVLFAISGAFSIIIFVFKIIICVKLSHFQEHKLKTTQLFYILSFFFGIIFTIIGFVHIKNYYKVNNQKETLA